MPSKLVTAPAVEPVTIQEALDYLRLDDDSDANFVTGLIPVGRWHVEKYCDRALVQQTWNFYFDDFIERDRRFKTGLNYPGSNVPIPYGGSSRWAQQWPLNSYLELGKPPIQSVVGVTYVDVNGETQTLDPSIYLVDLVSEPARIYLAPNQIWPPYTSQRNAICIQCVCGYGVGLSIGIEAEATAITGAVFEPTDVGSRIVIPGAGVTAGTPPITIDLYTTIAAVDDSGNATVANAAGTTVSRASVIWPPVPDTIKLAIKMVIANFYENREPVALVSGSQPYEMPYNIADILAPFGPTDRF
jgi:hypothetical protein